jgi:uncharacterized protein YutE (UPF0331/DUF86 family)
MADIREKVAAECENIERVLAEMPGSDAVEKLSQLELAGASAFLHNFYNGIENVLKHVALSKGIRVAQGPSWHTELVEACTVGGIISRATCEMLKKYLGFRHFFSHAYAFDVDKARMLPLLTEARITYEALVKDVTEALGRHL